jgi:hypothetical protein
MDGRYIEGTHDYPSAAGSIALNLREFCDVELFCPDMIADAARKAAEHIKTADEFATGRQSCETSRTLALSTEVTFLRRLAASSKAIFNLADGPHLYPAQNWAPHISILRCGHSRKRSTSTHLYRRDKRLLPIHQQRIRSSCYWATVNSSADRACVFTIADFRINFARVGTQTHMDLSELPPCGDWEPMATMTNRATMNRAKRLMG